MKRIGRTLAIATMVSCALTACSSAADSDRDLSMGETHAQGTAEETAAGTSPPPATSANIGAEVRAEESAPQNYSNPSTSILSLPSPGENPSTGVVMAETTESAALAGDSTPEEIVAEAGPRGQDYLRALRARGVPRSGWTVLKSASRTELVLR